MHIADNIDWKEEKGKYFKVVIKNYERSGEARRTKQNQT